MVAIPLLTLVPGELGGSETYVRELLRSLARVGAHDLRVVLPPAAPDAAEGLPSVVAPEYREAHTIRERLLAMTLGAARPEALRRHLGGADVVHFPLTIDIPRTKLPTVVTLHDVQHLELPFMFSRAERMFRSVFWHGAVRRADRVIVMSEFVAGTAVRRLGVPREKLRVVPLGVDHERLRPAAAPREPFVLYPAKRWRHKNHDRLLEAFALLRAERPELRLVLTGGGDFPEAPEGVDVR
ncbi:MAG TPA: glycosyltransferase, partial [Gaiellaceae bacterium]